MTVRQAYAKLFPMEAYPGVAVALHNLSAEIWLLRAVIRGYESRTRDRMKDWGIARSIIRDGEKLPPEEPFHG